MKKDRYMRRAKLLLVALPACLSIAAPALAADEHKQPAMPTTAGYDDSIRCQALYIALIALFGEESDIGQTVAPLVPEWIEFHRAHYPVDIETHHFRDVEVERDRILAELEAITDDVAYEARINEYAGRCEQLETDRLLLS